MPRQKAPTTPQEHMMVNVRGATSTYEGRIRDANRALKDAKEKAQSVFDEEAKRPLDKFNQTVSAAEDGYQEALDAAAEEYRQTLLNVTGSSGPQAVKSA